MITNKTNLFPFKNNALFQLTTYEYKTFETLFKQILEYNQTLKEKFKENHQSIIVICDIWFLLFHENAIERKNIKTTCRCYPLRYLYITIFLASDDFKTVRQRTRNDEQLALLYAIIYVEYFNKWLKQKVLASELLAYHLRIIDSFYQEKILNFDKDSTREFVIPRQVVFSEISFASEMKFVSLTKYCELKMWLQDAFQSIKKMENVISCKNHILKKRILLPHHLADLFSIFYARAPIFRQR